MIYYIVSFSWFSNWKKELMFRHCTGNSISYFILKWKNMFCKNHPVCISDFKTWTCGIMQSQIAHPPPQRGPLWPIYIYFFQKILPYMRHYNLLLIWNCSQLWIFFEEFPCLLHELSLILTALDYKPQWKMG